jgi:UDP-4-amino-4,6-dideoxy-N-acetyl-beta-L-altrosamine N-acetyltransferase
MIPRLAREWRNDPSIKRWCRESRYINETQQKEWEERIQRDPSICMLGISNGHDFVGVCGLTSINMVHRTAEFSLYIAPEYQKRGYAKEALIKLLHYGFNDLGLNNIWGEVLEGNKAMKIFKEVGFKYEGTLRQMYFKDGELWNCDRISILAEEFNI